ncbi:MAG: proteasome protein [Frankiales bacterium]|nr:proteasome protein [Frankiales bacterium]
MADPRELYEFDAEVSDSGADVLIIALAGFVDAGSAGRLASQHLLCSCDPQVVARFDLDSLYDYRARRPPMLFVEDHWESYEQPELTVSRLTDSAGEPFLLLTGPEPDFRWEAFVAAVACLMDDLGVRTTVGLNAIPMAVPHTRPVGITAHATRPELVERYEPWVQRVQVPGSAAHLLEFRLGSQGRDAIGFAAHVPHYLAQGEFPSAAVRLLQSVEEASGLQLPLDELRETADAVRRELDEQVAASEDVTGVVRSLEEQYDAFVRGSGRDLLASPNGPLPSADELGAEFEKFLAEQSDKGE